MATKYPAWFLKKLRSIKAKRAKTVIDHILLHGQITTEELKQLYGYDHPPRAARDVREAGIALETVRVTGSSGRKIGVYRFAIPSKSHAKTLSGRKGFPKQLKRDLLARDDEKCATCSLRCEGRYLQIDHKVPYEVEGDRPDADLSDFMLLCGSCNRAKSWSCEHCQNWLQDKDPAVCTTCYWASPSNYNHIALLPVRRADILWQGPETQEHDQLQVESRSKSMSVGDYIKSLLRRRLSRPQSASNQKKRGSS